MTPIGRRRKSSVSRRTLSRAVGRRYRDGRGLYEWWLHPITPEEVQLVHLCVPSGWGDRPGPYWDGRRVGVLHTAHAGDCSSEWSARRDTLDAVPDSTLLHVGQKAPFARPLLDGRVKFDGSSGSIKASTSTRAVVRPDRRLDKDMQYRAILVCKHCGFRTAATAYACPDRGFVYTRGSRGTVGDIRRLSVHSQWREIRDIWPVLWRTSNALWERHRITPSRCSRRLQSLTVSKQPHVD